MYIYMYMICVCFLILDNIFKLPWMVSHAIGPMSKGWRWNMEQWCCGCRLMRTVDCRAPASQMTISGASAFKPNWGCANCSVLWKILRVPSVLLPWWGESACNKDSFIVSHLWRRPSCTIDACRDRSQRLGACCRSAIWKLQMDPSNSDLVKLVNTFAKSIAESQIQS